MRLKIELVPKPLWGKNLRKNIKTTDWKKIRNECYRKANSKCDICGSKRKLNCHEKWEYDDKKHVQKLMGFKALCPSCHLVNHYGRAIQISSEGYIDIENIIKHFMRINNVDRSTFEQHLKKAVSLFDSRSTHEWEVDYSDWLHLIV